MNRRTDIANRMIPKNFKTVVVAINSEVFAARESVQTYQRVHVISAGSGAVLDFLGHQVDVGIQCQAVVE